MKLKDQVCSLKLAKQLKELGIRQYSLWYWIEEIPKKAHDDMGIKSHIHLDKTERVYSKEWTKEVNTYSAFTVAELGEGELLPFEIEIDGEQYFYFQFREEDKGEWQSNYENYNMKNHINKSKDPLLGPQEDGKYTHITEKTEANARAKMLIYLIENKLIND